MEKGGAVWTRDRIRNKEAEKNGVKRTMRKEAFRNIRSQIIAYISIAVIVMIAVIAYLGISCTGEAMKQKVREYYEERKMWDLEVMSTLMLDDGDLQAVRAAEGVEGAEPVLKIRGSLSRDGKAESVMIMGVTEDFSQPELQEGRLPEKPGECAIDQHIGGGLKVGDRVAMTNEEMLGQDPIPIEEWVITGIFYHPEMVTSAGGGLPNVLVTKDCFSQDVLKGQFMSLVIRTERAGAPRYSQTYWETVERVKAELNVLAEERGRQRTQEILNEYERSISEGKAAVEDAQEMLLSARQELDEGWRQLSEAETVLNETKEKLDKGGNALAEAEYVLASIPVSITGALSMIEDIDRMTGMNGGSQNPIGQYREGLKAYSEGRMEWYYAGEQYLDGMTACESGKNKLEQGESEYAEAKAQYEDGLARLAEAEKEKEKLRECRWLVLDNNSNGGYVFFLSQAENMRKLSVSFSPIFLVIAMLVIYASVARMVTEQRKIVGTCKALGLNNWEILQKYLIFGTTSTALGGLIGTLASWYIVQPFLLLSQMGFFTVGRARLTYLPVNAAIVLAGMVLLSAFSAWTACRGLLRSTALQLISGEEPGLAGRKKARTSHESVYSLVIVRNMFSERRRILVTIVSMAGCCLLLMVGLTMRYAVTRVMERQYGTVLLYDASIRVNPEKNEKALQELEALVEREGMTCLTSYEKDHLFMAGSSISSCTVIIPQQEGIEEFYRLRDERSGEALPLPETGVLIPSHIGAGLGIAPGDGMEIFSDAMEPLPVSCRACYSNYVGRGVFLSEEAYEEIFREKAVPNELYVRLENRMTLDELSMLVQGVSGVVQIKNARWGVAEFNIISQILNVVIVLLIGLAGGMAYFIEMNLSVTYIQNKKRELTVMRINGYTVRECIHYVSVDLIFTTVAGILLGLVLGNWLGMRIVRILETMYMQFVHEPSCLSFLYTSLVVAGFSIAINTAALSRIRKLKLADL